MEQSAANPLSSIVVEPGTPFPHDEVLNYIFNEDESSPPPRRSNQQPQGPKIPKVPEILRNLKTNEGCFDPRVVSIGPYHHGKPHLQEVEKLKTKLAKRYSSGDPPGGYGLYKKVKEVASEAREFYDIEPSKGYNDDEAFTKMMFLDGCFILEFMCLLVEERYQALGMKNNVIANVKRDLFLLENQLPYIVLKTLMVKKFKSAQEWNMRIDTFISICRRLSPAVKPWWLAATKYFHRSSPEDDKPPLHLLDMTRTRFVIPSATIQRTKAILPSATSEWYSYHSAKVLESKGIRFRPNKTDVMILRSKNVIINCLGNDQLVADLFNDIASNLVPNPHTYAEAKLGIQKHCNNKLKEWMAECYQAHCKNPWTLLALFGAIFAITLTVAQTYLAAVPPKK
nr:UPF0481 protein At3g47200-like [Ziziphus jujuba var. spinosa]